jgi:hypothetical protein
MTGASRDLAVLGEHLAVLGVLSRVIASSEAAVLVARHYLSWSRMAGTSDGQGESATDATSCTHGYADHGPLATCLAALMYPTWREPRAR